MSFYRRFPRNEAGRDFVVGDVHGCFDQLRAALAQVGFDEKTDRLFSVGDLVDRGPSSHEAVDWLDYPWFIAVRGNHEQMVIDADLGQIDADLHVVNGGRWFYGLSDAEKARTARAFAEMPIAIEVETPTGTVGLVHAEPVGLDWTAFAQSLTTLDDYTANVAMWSRGRIRVGDRRNVEGIDRVYVGHTPVNDWLVLGNVYYIDTGACFGKKLTLVCLSDGDVLQVAA